MKFRILLRACVAVFALGCMPIARGAEPCPPLEKPSSAQADAPPFSSAILCPIFWIDEEVQEGGGSRYLYFCEGYEACSGTATEDYGLFTDPDLYAESCEDDPESGPCLGPLKGTAEKRRLPGEHPIPLSKKVPADCELPPTLRRPEFTLLNNIQIKARVRVNSSTADPTTIYARVMTVAFRKNDVLQQRIFTVAWESEQPSQEPTEDNSFRVQDFQRRHNHLHRFRDNRQLYLVLSKQTVRNEGTGETVTAP